MFHEPPFSVGQALVVHPNAITPVTSSIETSSTRDSTVSSNNARTVLEQIPNKRVPDLVWPAGYHEQNRFVELDSADKSALEQYLRHELDVNRLEEIKNHLWMAGLMRPARSLCHQIILGRSLQATGDVDLHLLWYKNNIYLKPLPEFLLCYEVWSRHICKEPRLYALATGMFLSYVWLVCTPTDFKLAQQHGLLPDTVAWKDWAHLCKVLLEKVEYTDVQNTSPRYRFGELRLERINWIYRWYGKGNRLTNLVRGYKLLDSVYSMFFSRNTTWLVGLAGYLILALTAMQVGLATTQLQSSSQFQAVSYGLAIFSIFGPLLFLLTLMLYIGFLYVFNALYTLRSKRKKI